MKILKLLIIILILLSMFSCEEMPTDFPPQPTQTLLSLTDFQGIETNGVCDLEYFSIGERDFLVVANARIDSLHNIDSKIYEWNGFTFSLYQSIGTNAAHDWEYFSIEGYHYLAIANFYDDSLYTIDSDIYRWDADTELFVPFQAIATNGAFSWKYFSIEDNHYLVVANYNNGSTQILDSVIYRWNGVSFVSYQTIGTSGAYDWEYFTIDGSVFLAVSNYKNDSTCNIDSVIYKWNTGTSFFEEYQSIETNGASDWEYFSMNGDHYIAIANFYSDSIHNINSRIYKWNTNTESFSLYQALPTNGAREWEYFEVGENHFLMVANSFNDISFNIPSTIYIWNANQQQFTINQTLATIGAFDLHYFTLDDEFFLAVGNRYDGTTYNINSRIYKITF